MENFDLDWLSRHDNPRTVCECAVGPTDISIINEFVVRDVNLILIEPLPSLADAAEKAFGVKVHRVAVGHNPGYAYLVDNGGSSYLAGKWSPTPANPFKPIPHMKIEVQVVHFRTLDDGEIDVMNLDCEGQEWAVLSQMISRPALLAIELWENNPEKQFILDWLRVNHYVLRAWGGPSRELGTFLYSRG